MVGCRSLMYLLECARKALWFSVLHFRISCIGCTRQCDIVVVLELFKARVQQPSWLFLALFWHFKCQTQQSIGVPSIRHGLHVLASLLLWRASLYAEQDWNFLPSGSSGKSCAQLNCIEIVFCSRAANAFFRLCQPVYMYIWLTKRRLLRKFFFFSLK